MTGRRLLLAVGAVIVVAVVAVAAWAVGRGDTREVLIEPADSIGPDPFTTVALVTRVDTTLVGETGTTALFGGSGSQRVCDPEALIRHLQANPDKAEAWIDALNADPTLRWRGDTPLRVQDIPAYIRELRPVILAADARVTNHGYRDGEAQPRQSLLRAGTAVLVDADDVPRVRCACGNPLIPPDNPGEVCTDGPPCVPPSTRPPATTTTTEPDTTTTTEPTRTTTTRPPTVTTRPPPVTTTTTPPPPTTTTTTERPPTTTTTLPIPQ